MQTSQRRDIHDEIVNAAKDKRPVSGLTHGFYRYPARFSPQFVQSVINAFSSPGDWVLDPFVGGGTTLVEALAAGRNSVGIDISSLSAFICEAKTLLLTKAAESDFRRWQTRIPSLVDMRAPGNRSAEYASRGYYRNLEGSSFWRLRKAIEQCLASLESVRSPKARTLSRCVILRTAQWALDTRRYPPSVPQFRERLAEDAREMLEMSLELRSRVDGSLASKTPKVRIFNRAAAGAESAISRLPTPKLILTSPPYPGIHVLYHRWQVDGRKEAPAPFWIANKLDGAGLSYYTMGDRKNPGLKTYFENLRSNFASISKMAGPETTIVQMVAFSEREWQLPEYLRVLSECGLEEVPGWQTDAPDGRLWRAVPNRKWHAQQRARSPGAEEVVLIHRLKG